MTMLDAQRDAIVAEVARRVLAGIPKPRQGDRGERGPRGFDGRDGEIDPDEIRAEVARAFKGVERGAEGRRGPPGEQGPVGEKGEPGRDGQRGDKGESAAPEFPLHAEFVRDPVSKLTQRLLVQFSAGLLAIEPVHDGDGYMVAADFLVVQP